jgi:hypothetical protein
VFTTVLAALSHRAAAGLSSAYSCLNASENQEAAISAITGALEFAVENLRRQHLARIVPVHRASEPLSIVGVSDVGSRLSWEFTTWAASVTDRCEGPMTTLHMIATASVILIQSATAHEVASGIMTEFPREIRGAWCQSSVPKELYRENARFFWKSRIVTDAQALRDEGRLGCANHYGIFVNKNSYRFNKRDVGYGWYGSCKLKSIYKDITDTGPVYSIKVDCIMDGKREPTEGHTISTRKHDGEEWLIFEP